MGASAVSDVDVKTSVRAGYVVVTLRGEFDVTTAPDDVRAPMAPSVSGPQVIVDLADLAFMDCGSLRELVSARTQSRRAGGDLLLAGPQPIVLRLLLLTDMINHWPVFTSVDEAASGTWGAPAVPLTSDGDGRRGRLGGRAWSRVMSAVQGARAANVASPRSPSN
jgi:anti-sigma B factor antagonist